MTASKSDLQIPNPDPSTSTSPGEEDVVLSRASHLTRQELLHRRSHNLKQLTQCYKDHYWALMEDLKIQYRDYYWNFGLSPFPVKQDNNNAVADDDDNNNNNIHRHCTSVGCKLTAMALTSFCHLHILSDSKQRLYKPCDYVIKRSAEGRRNT